METSLDYIKKQFGYQETTDPLIYSSLVLAYIGDAIYETVIRTLVVLEGNRQVNKMHKESTGLVKAASQATIIKLIEDELTEDEHAVYKRGRNAKSCSVAKHASMIDYRMATGFEALMGFLYIKGDSKRMIDLVKLGIERMENINE